LLHLRPVQELLQVFVDTSLTPGVAWRKEIEGALAEARVAVLFISPESRVQWETQVVCSSVLIALSGLTVHPSLDLPLPRSASTESSKDIYDYDAGHHRGASPRCKSLEKPIKSSTVEMDTSLVSLSGSLCRSGLVNLPAKRLKAKPGIRSDFSTRQNLVRPRISCSLWPEHCGRGYQNL